MKKVALGIDIGGTNTEVGIVDNTGEILLNDIYKTKKFKNPEELVKQIYSFWINSNKNKQYQLKGIGIGAPNGNHITGCIEFAPNLNWNKKVNLTEMFKKVFNVPIFLNNDANAAALGEINFGSAKNIKDFIFITIGTGLGSCFVSNGKLIYGNNGIAGEFGHTLYEKNGRQCGCGKKGCLEAYVSANGIIKTAKELLKSDKNSLLHKCSVSELTPKLIFDTAKMKDKLAIKIFEKTGEILGEKLSDAVLITNPEAIILFGGICKAGNLILNPTKKSMEKLLLPIYKNKTKIIISKLLNKNAAVLGAASSVWQV